MDNDTKIIIASVSFLILIISGFTYHIHNSPIQEKYDTIGTVSGIIPGDILSYKRCVVEVNNIKYISLHFGEHCLYDIGDDVEITVYPNRGYVKIKGLVK